MHRGEGTEVHCTAIYMKEKKEHTLSYTGFTLRVIKASSSPQMSCSAPLLPPEGVSQSLLIP